MDFIILIIFLNNRADLSGYVESRTFAAGPDNFFIEGYGRGWLELKTGGDFYGGQAAFDFITPYDTVHFAGVTPGLDIARLAVWLGPENLRVTCGKQRIIWGVARVFRPLDLFNPADILEPGYQRPGITSILGSYAPGRLTDIRLLCQPRFYPADIRYAGRVGTNLLKNDLGLNAFYQPEERIWVAGADLAGELLVGYWAEATITREDSLHYFKATLGADYTFPGMVYALAEYFHDQSGEKDPADYDYQQLISGERSTLGQNYLYLSLTLARGLSLSPGLNVAGNLDDRSGILMPQVSIQPWDNTDLNLGMIVPFGAETGEFRRVRGFDAMAFVWAKVYF